VSYCAAAAGLSSRLLEAVRAQQLQLVGLHPAAIGAHREQHAPAARQRHLTHERHARRAIALRVAQQPRGAGAVSQLAQQRPHVAPHVHARHGGVARLREALHERASQLRLVASAQQVTGEVGLLALLRAREPERADAERRDGRQQPRELARTRHSEQ